MRPKLAHVIPNFQNPAGYTLSAAKRASCSSWPPSTTSRSSRTTPTSRSASRARGCRRCSRRTTPGKVVYASSFSKTVCPGIRVGYLVGPQAVIKQIQGIATNTYISPNMVAQSIVNQFCRSGRIDSAIATVKDALRARRDAVITALERELPEARFARPEGGYFMWVELPEAVDVAELEKAAKERDVVFVKGTDFLLEGGRNTLRLAYSGVTPSRSTRASRGSPTRCARSGWPPRGGPATRVERHDYGRGRSQFGELYLPGRRRLRSPVAVVIHGGFWRARYGRKLMRPLRRTSRSAAGRRGTSSTGGSGGSPAAAGRRRSATWPARSTTWRRSARTRGWTSRAWWRSGTRPAGTWRRGRPRAAAAEGAPGWAPRVPVTAAVAQAGVVDLKLAWDLRLSDGVVGDLLGGGPRSARCATGWPRPSSSSRSACPCCSPTAAATTSCRRRSASRSPAAARAAGDTVEVVELPDEDHFGHIDPANPLWKAVLEWLA